MGHRVEQLYYDRNDKLEALWEGKVERCTNPDCQDPEKRMFIIVYEGDEEGVEYEQNLYSDFLKGEVNLLD